MQVLHVTFHTLVWGSHLLLASSAFSIFYTDMLKAKKKLSTTTPKSANNNSTSRKAIPTMIVMATLLLVTSASMVAPAQAQLREDLSITIPEPPNGDDDDGELSGSVLECIGNPTDTSGLLSRFASSQLLSCIRAAVS